MATKFRLKNIEKTIKNFESRKIRASKPFLLVNVIGSKMLKDVDQHYRDETGPKRPWPKWSKRTASRRKFFSSRPTERGGNKLLQDTGRLKNSSRKFATKTTMGIVNRVKYASFHQKGTKNMPARKFYWLSRKAFKSIAVSMGRFIATGRKA